MNNFKKLESQLAELELLVLDSYPADPDRLAQLANRFPAHFLHYLEANHPRKQIAFYKPYQEQARLEIHRLMKNLNGYFVNSPVNYVENLGYQSLQFTLQPYLDKLGKLN